MAHDALSLPAAHTPAKLRVQGWLVRGGLCQLDKSGLDLELKTTA